MLDALGIGRSDVLDVATVIAAVFGVLAVWVTLRTEAFKERVAELRDDPEKLDTVVARLKTGGPMAAYRGWLVRTLALLNRHLGRGRLLLHWRGLGWAMLLSLFYVPVFLVVASLAGTAAVPFPILHDPVFLQAPPELPGPLRAALGGLSLLAWLPAMFIGGMLTLRAGEVAETRVRGWLTRLLRRAPAGWMVHLSTAIPAALLAGLIIAESGRVPPLGTLVAALFVVVLNIVSAPVLLLLMWAGLVMPHADMLPRPVIGALGTLAACVGFGVGEARREGDVWLPVAGVTLATCGMLWALLSPMQQVFGATSRFAGLALFGLLPIANALLDWISTAISRLLAERLLGRLRPDRRVPWLNLSLHLIADIAAAILLLLVLALILPVALHAHPGEHHFTEWKIHGAPFLATEGFACASARDPLGAGLWATLMLGSTLVPTVLHVTLVLASPLAHWLGPRPDLRRLLAQVPEGGAIPPALRAEGALPLAIARYERRERPLAIALGLLLAAILVAGATLAIYALLEAGAAHLLGVEGAGGTALALWFASGFDGAAVEACFNPGRGGGDL